MNECTLASHDLCFSQLNAILFSNPQHEFWKMASCCMWLKRWKPLSQSHSQVLRWTRYHPSRKCLMEYCLSRLHSINLRQDCGISKPGRNYIMLRNVLWHRVGALWHRFVCVQQFQHPMIFLFHTSGHEIERMPCNCLTAR